MTTTGWQNMVQKYAEALTAGKEVVILLKNRPDRLSGLIKEIDSDFLVLETKSGHLAALVALSEVAALQTDHGRWSER